MTKFQFDNVSIARTREGIITLPEKADLRETGAWLIKLADDEESQVSLNYTIDAFPFDGLVALHKAIKKLVGFARTDGTSVSFPIAYGEDIEVSWGRTYMIGIEGYIQPGIKMSSSSKLPILTVGGATLKKHQARISEIIAYAKELVKSKSIYQGKALRIKFPENPLEFDPTYTPRFLNLEGIDPSKLIFNREVEEAIEDSIYTPIKHRLACRASGLSKKRGILLTGEYGVGKSLLSSIIAKLGTDHGFTFIEVEQVAQLTSALSFAKAYSPAIVFAEDIDMVSGEDNRDEFMNTLSTAMDGVDSKAQEVLMIFTTNHPENIHPVFKRKGRMDLILHIPHPDAEAVTRLLRLYAGVSLAPEVSLGEVGKLLAGLTPAEVQETVQRAKYGAIGRTGKPNQPLTEADLIRAGRVVKSEVALITYKAPSEPSILEKAAQIISDGHLKARLASLESISQPTAIADSSKEGA